MTEGPNLFPDYPVAMLDRDGDAAGKLTVMTAGIVKAGTLVEHHLDRAASGDSLQGLNVPVKGDFGTGKTHLLTYAGHRFRSGAAEHGLTPSVVSVGAMETAPFEWYRSVIGPQIAALDLERLAVELFAEAAKAVARRAPLTAAAVPELESNPATARTLVERELLNPTAVEIELMDALEKIAPDVKPDVRRAIAGLVWAPRQSVRWLEGQALSEREVAATGLPVALATDELVADAIVALAASHARLRRPFLLLVDELEHFTRFDEDSGGKRNITWLKRLLARLASTGALVFIAGHSSAWGGQRDYFDRFSPNATIELETLSGEQVMEIAERHAGVRGSFTTENADLVAEVAEGNMRRVLTILHELHERSRGFETAVSASAIVESAAASGRRVDPEQAVEHLAASLSELGLHVQRKAGIAGIAFDLVAYEDARLAAVVEVKHALFGQKQQEQAQRFIEKLRVLNRDAPGCVGVFVSEGALDAGLLQMDLSAARMLWFDLTHPEFLEDVRNSLDQVLRAKPPSAVEGASAAERDAALSELVSEIQTLKDAQASIYDQLRDRLSTPAGPGATELEFRAPAREDTRDAQRAVYEDVSRQPSLAHRLGLLFGRRIVLAIGLFTFGVAMLVLASTLAEAIANTPSAYVLSRVVFFFAGAFGVVFALTLAAREYVVLDRFYSFKRERLRDVYVRDLPLEALIDTNAIFEEAINRYPTYYARRWASERLADQGLLLRLDEEP